MSVHADLTSLARSVAVLCIWLALLLIVFAPIEKIFGNRSQRKFRKFLGTDVFYYMVNGIVPNMLLTLFLTTLASGAHRLAPMAFYSSAAQMPVWLRLSLAFVVAEIGWYWGHRWSHEIPFLWRFHAVHHSADEMDWLVTAKAHPLDVFFTRLCATVPMYVLGLAQPVGNRVDLLPMVIALLTGFWAYFLHANVRWRFGWLEWLIATPVFHHWHHTNDGPEVIDRNYSAFFPWLDKCFGTLYLPREWPKNYGSDTPVAPHLIDQLLDPLTPRDSRSVQAPRQLETA